MLFVCGHAAEISGALQFDTHAHLKCNGHVQMKFSQKKQLVVLTRQSLLVYNYCTTVFNLATVFFFKKNKHMLVYSIGDPMERYDIIL